MWGRAMQIPQNDISKQSWLRGGGPLPATELPGWRAKKRTGASLPYTCVYSHRGHGDLCMKGNLGSGGNTFLSLMLMFPSQLQTPSAPSGAFSQLPALGIFLGVLLKLSELGIAL